MDEIGFVILILLAVGPFVLAAMGRRARPWIDEPPFKINEAGIVAYPTCLHCGWQGSLDVTVCVREAAQMKDPTMMKSPPCQKCGRRWPISLTAMARKYRSGVFA